jgi:hypothetical protein
MHSAEFIIMVGEAVCKLVEFKMEIAVYIIFLILMVIILGILGILVIGFWRF